MIVLNLRLSIALFFLTASLNAQHTMFKEIFEQYNSRNYEETARLIEEIDISQVPINNIQDSIQFSIFSLMKLHSLAPEKLIKEREFLSDLSYHFLFLKSNSVLEKFLPFYLIKYCYEFRRDRLDFLEIDDLGYFSSDGYIKGLLKSAISIEKEGLNQSVTLSSANTWDAISLLHLISSKETDYNDDYLLELINHYEANQSELDFIPKQIIIDHYNEAFTSKHFDVEQKKKWGMEILKIYSQIENKDILSSYYHKVNYILYQIRNTFEDKFLVKEINDTYRNVISEMDVILNNSFVKNYDYESFFDLENFVRDDKKMQLNYVDDSQKKYILNDIGTSLIKFHYSLYNDDYNITFDKRDLLDRQTRLEYFFHKKYSGEIDKDLATDLLKNSIDRRLQTENWGNDLDPEEKYRLRNEFVEIVIVLIENKNYNSISAFDFSHFIEYVLTSENKVSTNNEIVNKYYDSYIDNIDYSKKIQALTNLNTFFNKIIYNISGSKAYERVKSEYSDWKSNSLKKLNKEPSKEDFQLRVLLSSFEKLESLKNQLKILKDEKKITNDEFNFLTVDLYAKYVYENEEVNLKFYKSFMDNYDENNTYYKTFINTALNLAVAKKYNYKLVELANIIFKNQDENYENSSEMSKYYFELASGNFLKYIERYESALLMYLTAATRNTHYEDYGVSTRVNELLEKIFDLHLLLNDYDSAVEVLKDYNENYNYLEEIRLAGVNKLENDGSLGDDYDPNDFNDENKYLDIRRRSLDMERRFLFKQGKYKESMVFIDKLIELESIKEYYSLFQLEKLKFITSADGTSRVFERNEERLNLIDSIYKKYDKEYDEDYYFHRFDNGDITEKVVITQLSKFEKFIQQTKFAKDLSYRNQINLFTKTYKEFQGIQTILFAFLMMADNKEQGLDLKYMLNFDKFFDLRLKVDNMDVYNTALLNMNYDKTEEYFKLLNIIFNEKDYDKLKLANNNFDLFQQENKVSSDLNQEISLENFQSKLSSDQAYIRFVINHNFPRAYLIQKESIDIIEFQEFDINNLARLYSSAIKNFESEDNTFEILFLPIKEKLKSYVNKLYIKNDGAFNNINFETLWDANNDVYLFEKYNISYVERPSAIFSISDNEVFSSAFLFGNPDFSYKSEKKTNSKLRAGLNPLPFTKIEIEKLNSILSENGINTIATDFKSSTEKSLYSNSKSDIIHIATHGFYNEGNEFDRFNWGLLASGSKTTIYNDFKKERRDDGIIFGGEIITKNFTQTKLVVLSACETSYGTTTFFGGENLANTFLRAGAKNIISTLWPVDDQITQEFMSLFYSKLITLENIDSALRETKKTMKQKYAHPNYWGGFVLTQNKI